MMQEPHVLAAIDVGTTKVCTIVARKTGPATFDVLAHSTVPCEGLKKGNVVDVEATRRAIRDSLTEVEKKAGIKIQSAYVGVTGAHVSYENRWDSVGWAGERGVITNDDLMRVPGVVANTSAKTGREVLHAIPMAYSLDGKRGIRNPVGMHTSNLKVESHVVTGAPSAVAKLVEAVRGAGIEVEALVLEPLASSEAVLTPEEKQRGAVVADIGGGTTDVVAFRHGSIYYTSVVPVGGYQFTNDISVTYNTPYEVAETVKLEHAHTEPHVVGPNEEVTLSVTGRTVKLRVSRRDICQITRERAQELVRLIKLKLQEAQIGDVARVRLVLTGGSANLPGLRELVHRTLTSHVRIGVPEGHPSIPDELKSPKFSTPVGILLWGLQQHRPKESPATSGNVPGTERGRNLIFSRLFRQIKELIPGGLLSAMQGRKS
jgi:cell division protein FtsA